MLRALRARRGRAPVEARSARCDVGKLCTGAVARAFLRAFELAIELQQEHQASPPLARLRERHRSGGPVTVCMSRTKEDSHFHRHEEDSQATLSSSALMLHSSPHRSRPRLLPRPLHSPPHAPPPVGAPETAPESSCAARLTRPPQRRSPESRGASRQRPWHPRARGWRPRDGRNQRAAAGTLRGRRRPGPHRMS